MSSLTKSIRYILLAIAATIVFLPTTAAAAPGDLDTSFGNPNANSFVNSVAVQGDGKVLIGGDFTTVGGVSRNRVARLNADGTVDTSFGDPDGRASVISVAVQGDGKVLIGGAFTQVGGGVTRNYVARLNADGTLDTSFGDPGADASVNSVAVQDDGKVLIGGDFITVGVVARNRVARLNADGSLDTSFNPNADDAVLSVAVQDDGKVLIGGGFTTVGGQARNRVARLNADGTVDTSFGDPGAGASVSSIAVQGDGKILIGGQFTAVGGVSRNRVARLNADGTVDTSFGDPGAGASVNSVAVQGDGKVLIGGAFTQVGGGVTRKYVARLNADGSLDTSFSNPNADDAVNSVAVQDDGKVLIGGEFTTVGGVSRNDVARLLGTTPQVAPQGVRAAAGQEQATVSWTAVTGQISGYTATASPGGRTCTTTSTSCTVTGLTAGTAYTFTVTAANEFGSGPASRPSSAVIPTGAAPQQAGPAQAGPAQAGPALSAAVSASRARVTSGQPLRIGIRTRNTGTARAQKVVSCITLPSNFVVVSARGATRSARTLCFNVGTLAAGASASRAITVRAVSARTVKRVVTGITKATGVARVKATRKAVTITARARSPRVAG